MSPPQTVPLKQPIAIRTEYIVPKPTTLRVKQSSKSISRGDFSITRDLDGATLFSVDGKAMSWTQKRAFCDASGLPLFNLYQRSIGKSWRVELPEDRGNRSVVTLAPRASSLKDSLEVAVLNAAKGNDTTHLSIRGQDIWKLRTNVYSGDQVVMSAKRTDKLSVYVPFKGLEWIVDIAEGFDASLAAVIVVVLSATMFNSSMSGSMSVGTAAGIGAGAGAGAAAGGSC